MSWKAAGLLFAIDAAAIGHDVEDAASAGDQRRVDVELLFDRGRQTGGLRFVVSLHAVGDADLHGALRNENGEALRFVFGDGVVIGRHAVRATRLVGSHRRRGRVRRVVDGLSTAED